MIPLGTLSLALGLTNVGPAAVATNPDTACIVMDLPVAGRLSPLDSLTFYVADHAIKVCYGRPSSRGRTMIGGRDVPYGVIWRTGANEPTMIHTTVPIRIAGIEVEQGSYSLYTVPGEDEWTVIVNRSIHQWGHIAQYTYKVKELEVGRATVPRQRPETHVETMTFRAESDSAGQTSLILEWEYSRITIPIALVEP